MVAKGIDFDHWFDLLTIFYQEINEHVTKLTPITVFLHCFFHCFLFCHLFHCVRESQAASRCQKCQKCRNNCLTIHS